MARRERNIPEEFKDREIWSYSRISSFSDCPHGYWLNYIEKKNNIDNIYSVVGSEVHEIEGDLILNGLSNEGALERLHSVFLDCEVKDIHFKDEKIKTNYTESLQHYFTHYKPLTAKKKILEKELFFEIDGNVFILYPDMILEDENGNIEIHDFKTSSKYDKKKREKAGHQLVLYAYVVEKKFGRKISRLTWNMMKYVWVSWTDDKGKEQSEFLLRNQWVKGIAQGKTIKAQVLNRDIAALDLMDFEKEILLETAIKNNSLDGLPEHIQKKYKLETGYVDYDYNEETIQALRDFLSSNIDLIHRKDVNNEEDWKSVDCSDRDKEFFCSNLCGVRHSCKAWKSYIAENKDGFKPSVRKENEARWDELFN